MCQPESGRGALRRHKAHLGRFHIQPRRGCTGTVIRHTLRAAKLFRSAVGLTFAVGVLLVMLIITFSPNQ